MKELEDYVYKIYGDEYDEELCALEIEGISASFLAGYNVLRHRVLIKIAELKIEKEEIENKSLVEQIFLTRELNLINSQITLLKGLF